MLKAPCKDCADKHHLCHADCDKYIAYKIVNDILRNQQHNQKKLENDLWASSRHSKKRSGGRVYHDKKGDQ